MRSFRLARAAAACLITAGAAAVLLPPAGAAPPRIEAAGAFGGTLVQERWQPLLVTLTNGANGDAIPQGEVQVAIEDPRQNGARLATYTRRFSLARGPGQAQALVYVNLPAGVQPDATVYVLGPGGAVITRRTIERLIVFPPSLILLGISETPDALGYLRGRPLGVTRADGVLRPSEESGAQGPQFPPAPRRARFEDAPIDTVTVNTAALPDRALGYDAVGIIYLGDVPPDAFSDAQVAALRGWVAAGGLLVVGGPRFAEDRRFRPWMPARWAAPSDTRFSSFVPAGIPVRLLTPAPGARTPKSVFPQALGRVGRGTVIALGVDAASAEFAAWPGALPLWREVAGRGVTPRSVARALEDNNNWARSWFSRSVLRGPGLQAPSFASIGLFLLGYLTLLVPVNYAVLKRLDRREWTWLTVPLLVAVFCAGSYGFGYAIKGGRMLLNTAAIVEMGSGDGTGPVTMAAGLFSPRRAAYDVALADPQALLYAPDLFDRSQGDNGPLVIGQDQGARARGADVAMWAMRVFGGRSTVTLGEGLRVSLAPDGGMVAGTIENRTGRDLSDVLLSLPGASQNLGALKAGQARNVRLPFVPEAAAANGIRPPLFENVNQGRTVFVNDGGPNGAATREAIRRDIQQAITNTLNNQQNRVLPRLRAGRTVRVHANFRETPLPDALQQILGPAGVAFSIEPDVPNTARITRRFRGETQERALDAVTRPAGLQWRRDRTGFGGEIYRIGKNLPPRPAPAGPVPATVTAWNYEPLLPVRVDGRTVPAGEHVNLLIVHAAIGGTAGEAAGLGARP